MRRLARVVHGEIRGGAGPREGLPRAEGWRWTPQGSRSADATDGFQVDGRRGAQVELVAAIGQVAFELAEGLVFLVADPGDGEVHRLADLGDGPTSRPELDDPVLARGQDGLPRR